MVHFRKNLRLLFLSSVAGVMTACAQTAEVTLIERGFKNNSLNPETILSDERYDHLRELPEFRALLRRYPAEGRMVVVTSKEPGKIIEVKGRLVDKERKPQAGRTVFFYHTMHDGLYTHHPEDSRATQEQSRLYGFMKTDRRGEFQIRTIMPGGYPGEAFPSHIHVLVFEGEKVLLETEFLFDDDPRLIADMRRAALRHGYLIAASSGNKEAPVYSYTISLP